MTLASVGIREASQRVLSPGHCYVTNKHISKSKTSSVPRSFSQLTQRCFLTLQQQGRQTAQGTWARTRQPQLQQQQRQQQHLPPARARRLAESSLPPAAARKSSLLHQAAAGLMGRRQLQRWKQQHLWALHLAAAAAKVGRRATATHQLAPAQAGLRLLYAATQPRSASHCGPRQWSDASCGTLLLMQWKS